MTKYKILIASMILFSLPLTVKAATEFNPDFLISDYELTNYQTMIKEEIVAFLKGKNGELANYFVRDLDNQIKHAGEIIYNASQRHQINPQVLITIIQKEQTLITQPAIKPSQLDWATGFACYDYRRPVSRFSGFTTQVDRAAWRLRYFLEHPWEFRYRPGLTYKIDLYKVKPRNSATAVLYNYTPHVKGNKLFWQIWQKWFANQSNELFEGALVRAKAEAGVWLIQNGERRPFYSRSIFLARYNFKDVQEISSERLNKYPVGRPMSYPNYSILKSSLGDLFLLVDDLKREIISQEIFRKIGFHPDEIIEADDQDLAQYSIGEPITTPYPSGALLQDNSSGAIYFVKDAAKYPIIDRVILWNNFPYNQIISVSPKELKKFEDGSPIKFLDGTLIKTVNWPTVYLVSQGEKRPIISEETFEALGYQWENIVAIPEVVFNIHPLGDILDINKI